MNGERFPGSLRPARDARPHRSDEEEARVPDDTEAMNHAIRQAAVGSSVVDLKRIGLAPLTPVERELVDRGVPVAVAVVLADRVEGATAAAQAEDARRLAEALL